MFNLKLYLCSLEYSLKQSSNPVRIHGFEMGLVQTWMLLYACSCGSYDCLLILLMKGMNVNQQDVSGCTPLHLAARNGWVHVTTPCYQLWKQWAQVSYVSCHIKWSYGGWNLHDWEKKKSIDRYLYVCYFQSSIILFKMFFPFLFLPCTCIRISCEFVKFQTKKMHRQTFGVQGRCQHQKQWRIDHSKP